MASELPLDEDPEYSDLKRVPQDDGPVPVVAIRYSAEFILVMDYFRAVLWKGEISERAFKLTNRVIKLNPSNYTAWQFRRRCIFDLKKDLYAELEFLKETALATPKNYQLWWHRREIIQRILADESQSGADISGVSDSADASEDRYDPNDEKPLVREILRNDGKNYHAWSHLHWVLKKFGNFETELEYTAELLRRDCRNNSAYNHRHFVIESTTGFTREVLEREMKFCQSKIGFAAENHSVWFYYTDIVLDKLRNLMMNEEGLSAWMQMRKAEIDWMSELLRKQPYSSRANLYFIDLLCDDQCATSDDISTAVATCDVLSLKVDRIRHNYYAYLKETKILTCPTIEVASDDTLVSSSAS